MTAYYNEYEPYAAEWLRNLIKKGLIPDGEVDTRSIVDVAPDDVRSYTQCHFFAGIGGWGHALRLAGWPDDRPIWTGSCPCQPFSVAGKGAGTDDPRHLWPHFHRLIIAVRPPVVMGEQVAGAAGYGWLDGVRADLAREGYASRGVDIPACSVDAPHIRQRLYWVALDVGNTNHKRLEGRGGAQRDEQRADGQVEPRSVHDDVADASNQRRQGVGLLRDGGSEVLEASRSGEGHMADASSQPRQQDTGSAFGDEASNGRTGRHTQQPDGHHGPSSYGEGFWDDHIWLTGADGKARRSKPSLPLLAHGVSNRVGRLRAYGNAIVPQVAAEVIKAFMDCEP